MISKTFCVLIATLLIIGSADIAPAHQGGDDDSQVIFYNGKIFTNDNAHKDRAAKFVGVKEGHVVVVGDDLKDLFKHIKKDTEFVNLFGRTLVPGTIDRHDRFDIDNIKG
jgi:imidazolonepropionase-like amidohydrolase